MRRKFISFIIALSFVVLYRLVLIHIIKLDHEWISFWYFYGYGLFVYALASWALIDMKCINLSNPTHRKWMTILTAGLALAFCAHGLWFWLALNTPYKGF